MLQSSSSDIQNLLEFLDCIFKDYPENVSFLREIGTALIAARCSDPADSLEKRMINWIALLQSPMGTIFANKLLLPMVKAPLVDLFRKVLEHHNSVLPGTTMEESSLSSFRRIIHLIPALFRTLLLDEFFPTSPVSAASDEPQMIQTEAMPATDAPHGGAGGGTTPFSQAAAGTSTKLVCRLEV